MYLLKGSYWLHLQVSKGSTFRLIGRCGVVAVALERTSFTTRSYSFKNSLKYGGCSADRIDEVLAPYAEKNYQKHLKDAEEWVLPDKHEEYAWKKTQKDIYP